MTVKPRPGGNLSEAERIAASGPHAYANFLATRTPGEMRRLRWDWKFWARPKQKAPPGDWATWVVRAGRGFGKTRTFSGWIHDRAMAFPHWLAIVSRTPGEARNTVIDGPSGLLRVTAPWERPRYQPSLKRLQWPNGSYATIYSDENPDELRGFSGATAGFDEFAKFKHAQECWDMLNFGMREVTSDKPRRIITTTPRPLAILRKIEASASTVLTWGHSEENRANLDPEWYLDVIEPMKGTRLGRQEIAAEFLDDAEGALWSIAMLDRGRIDIDRKRPIKEQLPLLRRIVIGVDPAGTSKEGTTARTGIVVVGLGVNGHGYVLDDLSGRYTPREWAKAVNDAYRVWGADLVVAEGNFGGEMVESTMRTVNENIPVKIVHASVAKQARAQPVSSLSEREPARLHMAGLFPELEDELRTWEPERGLPSPNHLDAMVWAVTELMITGEREVFPTVDKAITIPPRTVESIWPRVCALQVWPAGIAALWLARDRATDTVYLYDEMQFDRIDVAIAAEAIRRRGAWIPVLFDLEAENRSLDEGAALAYRIADLGVSIMNAKTDLGAGIDKILERVSTDRLKVFSTLERWRNQYRTYRVDEQGKLLEIGDQLLRASALLLQHGLDQAVTERKAESDRRDVPDLDDYRRGANEDTGY